tara:strand:- start:543 stop:929 length:387 start_codon:yes stop_codon:yes gene_type:complete
MPINAPQTGRPGTGDEGFDPRLALHVQHATGIHGETDMGEKSAATEDQDIEGPDWAVHAAPEPGGFLAAHERIHLGAFFGREHGAGIPEGWSQPKAALRARVSITARVDTKGGVLPVSSDDANGDSSP